MNWVGRRAPMHATAAGKVFLTFPDDAGRPAEPAELTTYTPRTITDHAMLRAQLAQVRERGWSLCVEEQEDGLVAVGAPVRDASGAVVAAITVSGPTFRMTEGTVAGIAEHAVAAADEIAFRNGLPKRG